MKVTLGWRKLSSGSKSAYLDISKDGQRTRKSIDIILAKNDPQKKEKLTKAELIRSKYYTALFDKRNNIVSEDKRKFDFLKYFQLYLFNYKKAGVRKYRYAYEKFLSFLKESGIIKEIILSKDSKHKYSTVGNSDKFMFKDLNYLICLGFKEYLYGPDSGLKGETPYDYFKRFKAVLTIAVDEGFLIANPAIKVKLKKPDNDLKKQILHEDELQILANTHCGNEEVKRAFLFACFTGLGEKEIRSLKWSQVSDGRLDTRRAKNQRKVSLKLPQTAIKLLGETGLSNGLIFNLPSAVAIGKNLTAWVKRAEIKKHISFYCGRHTFAILNLKNGANLKTISKLMGHKSTVPTNKYLNYLDAEKDKAMDKLIELDI